MKLWKKWFNLGAIKMYAFLDTHPILSYTLGIDAWSKKATKIITSSSKAYTNRSVLSKCYYQLKSVQKKYTMEFWRILAQIATKFIDKKMNQENLDSIINTIPKSPVGRTIRRYIVKEVGLQENIDIFFDKVQNMFLPAESDLAQIDFYVLDIILASKLVIIEDTDTDPLGFELLENHFGEYHVKLIRDDHKIAKEERHTLSIVTMDTDLLKGGQMITDKTDICDVTDINTFCHEYID